MSHGCDFDNKSKREVSENEKKRKRGQEEWRDFGRVLKERRATSSKGSTEQSFMMISKRAVSIRDPVLFYQWRRLSDPRTIM